MSGSAWGGLWARVRRACSECLTGSAGIDQASTDATAQNKWLGSVIACSAWLYQLRTILHKGFQQQPSSMLEAYGYDAAKVPQYQAIWGPSVSALSRPSGSATMAGRERPSGLCGRSCRGSAGASPPSNRLTRCSRMAMTCCCQATCLSSSVTRACKQQDYVIQ